MRVFVRVFVFSCVFAWTRACFLFYKFPAQINLPANQPANQKRTEMRGHREVGPITSGLNRTKLENSIYTTIAPIGALILLLTTMFQKSESNIKAGEHIYHSFSYSATVVVVEIWKIMPQLIRQQGGRVKVRVFFFLMRCISSKTDIFPRFVLSYHIHWSFSTVAPATHLKAFLTLHSR